MIFKVFKSIREREHPEALYSLISSNGKRAIYIDTNCVYFDTRDLSGDAREQKIFSVHYVSTTDTVQYDIQHLDQLIRTFTINRNYFCSINFDQTPQSISLKSWKRKDTDDPFTNILEIESTDAILAISENIEKVLLPIVRQVLNNIA